MAVSFYYFAFGCFVFLAFQQVAYSVTCYTCSACGSNSNSWGTQTDLGGNAACFKYDYKDKPIVYTNRGIRAPCSPGSDGADGTYYCCSTDYCNGSVSLSSSLGLVFTLITTFYTFTAN